MSGEPTPAELIRRAWIAPGTRPEDPPMTRTGPSLAFAVALMTATALAQQSPQSETAPSHTDRDSSGTAPGGMGSSGWTGGLGGSHIGTSNSHTTGAAPSAAPDAGQPEMATGRDLMGPPTRFRAADTPE